MLDGTNPSKLIINNIVKSDDDDVKRIGMRCRDGSSNGGADSRLTSARER